MDLEPFVAKQVNPGEPITAQAWNDIVLAIGSITGFLAASTGTGLRVIVGNASADPSKTRVLAIAENGSVSEGALVPPEATESAPGGIFSLKGLVPGSYTIRAEAPGFIAATETVTMPRSEPLTLTMTSSAPFMPLVFGRKLSDALSELATANINVSRILDITGQDVAPGNPPPEHRDSPVLMQFPPRGEPVPVGGTAQLVVAAALELQASIEMPSLAGLSLPEARRVLDELGLVLGRVT